MKKLLSLLVCCLSVAAVISSLALFQSCNFAGKGMSQERRREAQKDSLIHASFKGLPLGESYDRIITILDSLKITRDIYDVPEHVYDEISKDRFEVIDALTPSKIYSFGSYFAFKNGDVFEEVEITCHLSFFEDTLCAIVVKPCKHRDDLGRDKVLETYINKYGRLYSIEQVPRRELFGRMYATGEGWAMNQIHETEAYSSDNLVWKYKDAAIYLCDMTEYVTLTTYNEDTFNREWRDLQIRYGYDQYDLCRRIKDRLYGSEKHKQIIYPFIAYKYLPIYNREIARREAAREARAKALEAKKAAEDSAKNAEVQKRYSKQDF